MIFQMMEILKTMTEDFENLVVKREYIDRLQEYHRR